jgi:hypothetical protein
MLKDYLFDECGIRTDFIDVLLKTVSTSKLVNAGSLRIFFACSFGLKTLNLFVKPAGQPGRSIRASFAQVYQTKLGRTSFFFLNVVIY